MDLTFELAPKPGTTLSQRKKELNETRFVAIRNLAYIHYKKPDGTQLMSYNDTLADREIVKNKILEYELACGLIQEDGSGLLSQQQQPQANPANGAQNGHVMQPAPMQQMGINAVMPTQQVSQMQPAPQAAMPPAPQVQAAFTPPAAPQMPQAAQPMAQAPQAAPAVEAAGQRPSRRKINGVGAGVASPPAAPPVTQAVQAAFPTSVPVAQTQGIVQQEVQPAPFQPMAFSPPAPQAAPVQTAVPAQAPASIDLSQIVAALDQLGRGVSTAANNADQVIKMVSELSAKVTKIDNDQQRILAALHHLYMMNSNPALTAALGECKTVPDFKKYLTTYALPAGTP